MTGDELYEYLKENKIPATTILRNDVKSLKIYLHNYKLIYG